MYSRLVPPLKHESYSRGGRVLELIFGDGAAAVSERSDPFCRRRGRVGAELAYKGDPGHRSRADTIRRRPWT